MIRWTTLVFSTLLTRDHDDCLVDELARALNADQDPVHYGIGEDHSFFRVVLYVRKSHPNKALVNASTHD